MVNMNRRIGIALEQRLITTPDRTGTMLKV